MPIETEIDLSAEAKKALNDSDGNITEATTAIENLIKTKSLKPTTPAWEIVGDADIERTLEQN